MLPQYDLNIPTLFSIIALVCLESLLSIISWISSSVKFAKRPLSDAILTSNFVLEILIDRERSCPDIHYARPWTSPCGVGFLCDSQGCDSTLLFSLLAFLWSRPNFSHVRQLQLTNHISWLSNTYLWGTVISVIHLKQYKCPLLVISSLWQMPLWYQVTHTTATPTSPSGIISLCKGVKRAYLHAVLPKPSLTNITSNLKVTLTRNEKDIILIKSFAFRVSVIFKSTKCRSLTVYLVGSPYIYTILYSGEVLKLIYYYCDRN